MRKTYHAAIALIDDGMTIANYERYINFLKIND
jgi:hypothetical protein